MKRHHQKMLNLASKLVPHLRGFYLAGGTALMLRHRHRISIDLDFFKEKSFSKQRILKKLQGHFFVENFEISEDTIDIFIEGTKVSFVFFPFKNIRPLERIDSIPVASDYDIFLNKIYAAGRRVDPKDPLDVAFLYRLYRWDREQIKRDFERKFPSQSFEIYLGALLSFDDYPDLDNNTKQTLLSLM